MSVAVLAHVGLGSNLGDSRATIALAIQALGGLPGCELLSRSADYQSPPWGPVPQPDYINAAVRLRTRLTAQDLLGALLDIERAFGRVRPGERWGPRTLDLDLLLHGDTVCDTEQLQIPHPRMASRAFVLLPLADIDPGLVIPGQGTVASLLARVDASGCRRLDGFETHP
jgi:2-amino-4-hydroxy-6-hydroxymethyldihydropteridine diphosphokinase